MSSVDGFSFSCLGVLGSEESRKAEDLNVVVQQLQVESVAQEVFSATQLEDSPSSEGSSISMGSREFSPVDSDSIATSSPAFEPNLALQARKRAFEQASQELDQVFPVSSPSSQSIAMTPPPFGMFVSSATSSIDESGSTIEASEDVSEFSDFEDSSDLISTIRVVISKAGRMIQSMTERSAPLLDGLWLGLRRDMIPRSDPGSLFGKISQSYTGRIRKKRAEKSTVDSPELIDKFKDKLHQILAYGFSGESADSTVEDSNIGSLIDQQKEITQKWLAGIEQEVSDYKEHIMKAFDMDPMVQSFLESYVREYGSLFQQCSDQFSEISKKIESLFYYELDVPLPSLLLPEFDGEVGHNISYESYNLSELKMQEVFARVLCERFSTEEMLLECRGAIVKYLDRESMRSLTDIFEQFQKKLQEYEAYFEACEKVIELRSMLSAKETSSPSIQVYEEVSYENSASASSISLPPMFSFGVEENSKEPADE